MSDGGRHRFPGLHLRHGEPEPSSHEIVEERAPRPIWLPQLAEPVTLVLSSGETLPARIVERAADMLLAAVVVPTTALGSSRLDELVLEYANPGGRVRLQGDTELESSPEGDLVRIGGPRLIEVIQQRSHVRVDAECPITVRLAREAEPLQTHTLDLSAGGVLLAAPDLLRRGERLTFQLQLEPGKAPVEGSAEVVRLDAYGRAGIRFGELAPNDQWRLIRFTVEIQGRETFRHADLDL